MSDDKATIRKMVGQLQAWVSIFSRCEAYKSPIVASAIADSRNLILSYAAEEILRELGDWTVIGHYDEGDTYCQHVMAKDEIDAAAQAISLSSEYCRDSLVIDGVIRGTHELIVLSNSGKGVYAEDVLAMKIGEEFNGLL